MRLVALSFGFAFCMACGGGNKRADTTPPPTPDQIPKTAGPDCGAVAEHLLTIMEKDSAGNADKQAGAKVRDACKNDAWTDDARSCFATANTDDEADGCVKLLTDTQKKALTEVAKPKEPAAAESAAAPPPPADKPKPTTRGAVKKDKSTRAGDPCQGGE